MNEGEVRWWRVPWWERAFTTVIAWTILAVGVLFVADTAYMLLTQAKKDWTQVIGAPAYLAFAWLLNRVWLVGIAIGDGELLICRLFPGRTERVPFASVRLCQVGGTWIFNKWLRLYGPSTRFMPLTLQNNGFLWGRLRWCIPEWDELRTSLREKLEPLGKWRN